MTRATEIFVPGVPQPQGSKSAFALKTGGAYTGRTAMTEQNKKLKPWRRAVADTVRALGAQPHPGPVTVRAVFVFERPAGHMGSGRNVGRPKPSAPLSPAVKPDIDKLCRAILDSLKDARIIAEDSRVVGLNADKIYAGAHAVYHRPGAYVTVTDAD